MTKQEQEFWAIEERALDLWREKQHSAALTLMDEALAQADTQGRQDIVLALARTASVIATSGEIVEQAIAYTEMIIVRKPADAFAHFVLGKLHRSRGDQASAAQHFRTSH